MKLEEEYLSAYKALLTEYEKASAIARSHNEKIMQLIEDAIMPTGIKRGRLVKDVRTNYSTPDYTVYEVDSFEVDHTGEIWVYVRDDDCEDDTFEIKRLDNLRLVEL